VVVSVGKDGSIFSRAYLPARLILYEKTIFEVQPDGGHIAVKWLVIVLQTFLKLND
jgi:hypothetical protein